MNENKLSRSNTRKTYKSKIKSFGYSLALVTALGLTGCGSSDLDVKKAAEEYQDAVEKVKEAKENLKNKEDALKEAEKDFQEAEKDFQETKQELYDAQREEAEAKKHLQKESNKL